MSRHLGVVVLVTTLVLGGCTPDDGSTDAGADGGASSERAAADAAGDVADEDGEVQEDPPSLELVADDTLTVCAEASYPPFEFVDEDSELGYSGFDIELIAAVAATQGIGPVTIVEVGFEDIVSGAVFAEGTCDVGASAIPITAGRAERIEFSEPYYVSRRALIVPMGSPLGALDELERGMVLGVQEDTAAADRAAAEVEAGEVRTFEDGEDLHAALVAGELDAALHDLAIARKWVEADDELEVAEQYRRIDEFGFALARDRGDGLLDVLNGGLEQVRLDGTHDALFERFFGVDD